MIGFKSSLLMRQVVILALGTALVLLAVETVRTHSSNRRIQRTLEAFRASSYGRFELRSLEGAARLVHASGAVWPPSDRAHIILLLGEDQASADLSDDWATALTNGGLPDNVALTLVGVGTTTSWDPLVARLKKFVRNVAFYRADSTRLLFNQTGVDTLPFSLAHAHGELRCVLSGRSSVYSAARCIRILTSPSESRLIERTEGRSLIPPAVN